MGGQGLLEDHPACLSRLGVDVVGVAAGKDFRRRQSPWGAGHQLAQLDGHLLPADRSPRPVPPALQLGRRRGRPGGGWWGRFGCGSWFDGPRTGHRLVVGSWCGEQAADPVSQSSRRCAEARHQAPCTLSGGRSGSAGRHPCRLTGGHPGDDGRSYQPEADQDQYRAPCGNDGGQAATYP